MTAKAAVMEKDLSGERAQLEPRSQARIQRRFSGAGAVAGNGDVLGIVVTVWEPARDAAFMVTVATLTKYTSPVIDRYLTSRTSQDASFSLPKPQAAEVLGSRVRRRPVGAHTAPATDTVAAACITIAACTIRPADTVRNSNEPDSRRTLSCKSDRASAIFCSSSCRCF